MEMNSNVDDVLKKEIVNALLLTKEREEPVILSPQEKPVSLFSVVTEVNNDYVNIKNTIPHIMIPYILSVPLFTLQFRSYWIKFSELIGHGREIMIPIKNFGLIETTRTSERVCFSDKDNAKVKITHPFDTATILWRRIFDLSEGGMSFRSYVNSPFLQPGRLLPNLEIQIDNKIKEKKQGKIVYVKQIIDSEGQDYFQVGVQFFNQEQEKQA